MRAISLSVVFLLLALLCTQVLAAPAAPVIDSTTPDCVLPIELEPPLLSVGAHSPEGGTLEYQWYSAAAPDLAAATLLTGAVSCGYTPAATPGTMYYCAAVRNISDGARSEAVYSRWISVTFIVPTTSVEILSLPDKLDYFAGESPDLTGLRVRIQYGDLTFEAADGAQLEYARSPLTIGTQEIILRYGDATASFFVTVRTDPGHVHTYPDGWIVVREAGCEEAGERIHTCPCGAVEREAIPAAGHVWDAGKAIKRGTKYTCTVCGASYTQKNSTNSVASAGASSAAAGSSNVPSAGPSENSAAPQAQQREPAAEAAHSPPGAQTEDSSPATQTGHYMPTVQKQRVTLRQREPWKYIALAAIILACCALLAFFLGKNKKQDS